jgi:hypothetical protein
LVDFSTRPFCRFSQNFESEILRLAGEQPMEMRYGHDQGFANDPKKASQAGKKAASTK